MATLAPRVAAVRPASSSDEKWNKIQELIAERKRKSAVVQQQATAEAPAAAHEKVEDKPAVAEADEFDEGVVGDYTDFKLDVDTTGEELLKRWKLSDRRTFKRLLRGMGLPDHRHGAALQSVLFSKDGSMIESSAPPFRVCDVIRGETPPPRPQFARAKLDREQLGVRMTQLVAVKKYAEAVALWRETVSSKHPVGSGESLMALLTACRASAGGVGQFFQLTSTGFSRGSLHPRDLVGSGVKASLLAAALSEGGAFAAQVLQFFGKGQVPITPAEFEQLKGAVHMEKK